MFETVWSKIVALRGTEFHTGTRRLPFTYDVVGDVLRPTGKNRNIPKSNFESVYQMPRIPRAGEINQTIQGASYVLAILADPRVRA